MSAKRRSTHAKLATSSLARSQKPRISSLSAAFSASSELLGLNNEAPSLKRKNISATIAADVKRFCHQIKNGQGFRYTQAGLPSLCLASSRIQFSGHTGTRHSGKWHLGDNPEAYRSTTASTR